MKRKQINYRGEICLNCNTALDKSEQFCHACGQLNSTKKLTISDFIEEFFSNFYAYDSRLRNSIISIFTKPGVLAREFNAGKRHTYANPFRLFLSVTLLLFIVLKATEGNPDSKTLASKNKMEQQEAKIDSMIISTSSMGKKKTKQVLNLQKDSIYTKKEIEANTLESFQKIEFQITSFRNFYNKYPSKTDAQALKELGYEVDFINNFLYSKAKLFKTNEIGKEIFDYFYGQMPFLLFLALPFLTVIFWIVFYSKNRNYTEHLVFTYTFYTFMFLTLIFLNLVEIIIPESVMGFFYFGCFGLIFPFYLYKSLRNFYQQSRWKTFFKWIILHPLFLIFSNIASLILMLFGAILF